MDTYRVKVDSIELPSQNLRLSIYNGDDYIGNADTSGNAKLPDEFPYEFKLVAYMDPVIRKTWVDLRLMKGPATVAEGSTAVNSPLNWEGLNFYHTATNTDQLGKSFVGIQITRDPGITYVYIGFFILSMGVAYYLLRRMYGLR